MMRLHADVGESMLGSLRSRLDEVRQLLAHEDGRLADVLRQEKDPEKILDYARQRERIVEARRALLLSNLVRVALEDFIEEAFSPVGLLYRLTTSSKGRPSVSG